jgi:hypothetical protein
MNTLMRIGCSLCVDPPGLSFNPFHVHAEQVDRQNKHGDHEQRDMGVKCLNADTIVVAPQTKQGHRRSARLAHPLVGEQAVERLFGVGRVGCGAA